MNANEKRVRIIGIPLDLGQSRRGVDMGPSAIRYADLSARLQRIVGHVEDAGNIAVPVREHLNADKGPLYASAIAEVCEVIYAAAERAIADGCFPLFLGGDHSLAIGTIGGITSSGPAGVIWFDAHGDFNVPETSPNGNIHGMPVSVLAGYGIDTLINIGRPGAKIRPTDIVLVGVRDLDYDEKTLLRQSGIKLYTMRNIDTRGIAAVVAETLDYLSDFRRIHISFDMDVLDPAIAPGVGTPSPGGLTYREAHLAMELISSSGQARSMDIVEINPILDHRNDTAIIGVELIASLLGQRII